MKKWYLALIATGLLSYSVTEAAVAVLDSVVSTAASALPANFSISAGSNRLLVACTIFDTFDNDAELTQLPYGGQNMTHLTSYPSGTGGHNEVECAYLNEAGIAAAGDTAFDTATWNSEPSIGGSTSIAWFVISFSGVDQTSPIAEDDGTGHDDTTDPIVVTLSNVNDGYGFAVVGARDDGRNYDWTGGDLIELSDQNDSVQTWSAAGLAMTSGAGTSDGNANHGGGTPTEHAIAGIVLNPAAAGGGSADDAILRRRRSEI